MIPSDAPNTDWNLYYNDTYMSHITLGPCMIRVQHDEFGRKALFASAFTEKTHKARPYHKVESRDLRILWPRPGAYNFTQLNGAGFIGRTPQRHMKRSAYRDHYYVQWSPIGITPDSMMRQIVCPAPYTPIKKFNRVIQNDEVTMYSVALSSKVIVFYAGNQALPTLIYMAEEMGHLDKDNSLIPFLPYDSRLIRIRRHLSTIGLTTIGLT